MIGVRNATYVVGCEVVPYLGGLSRHRRDLTIGETYGLRCDLLAEIFGDAGKARFAYPIRNPRPCRPTSQQKLDSTVAVAIASSQ